MKESLVSTLIDPSKWSFTTVFLVITTIVLVNRIFLKKVHLRGHNQPPSPSFQLPIIGHLHLLSPDLGEPFRRFRKDLGDIFSLKLGNRHCVVLSGLDVIKDALNKSGDAFLDRPHLPILAKLQRGEGLFSVNGNKWREHRSFTLKTLRDFGMGKSIMQTTIHEEIKLLFETLDAKQGRPCDPKLPFTTSFANIVCTLVFGSTFQHGDETFQKLMDGIDENLTLGLLTGALNFLPALQWLPGDPFKLRKMERNSDELFKFVETVVSKHKTELDEKNINNYVSAYIDHLRNMEQSGKPTTFTVNGLAATFGDLIGAGVDTSVTLVLWCLPLLAEYQDIQQTIFEGIQTHVGTSRLPTVEDRSKLPLVEAFFFETTRYTQMTSVNAPRAVVRDVEFQGYYLPAGTIIMMNVGSIMEDPNIWPNPNTFDPNRFLGDDGRLLNREELLTFGSGKRNCVGESLARMEVFLILSALIQKYEILRPEGADVSKSALDGIYRAVRAPKPYQLVFKERK